LGELGLQSILDFSDAEIHPKFVVKLSNKGRYGIRALFDIAFHNEGGATQIKDIADRQSIPARFLEQIFQDLKKAGLVTSKRGPRGGYALAGTPNDVKLGDVLRAIEGPIVLIDGSDTPAEGDSVSRAILDEAFGELAEAVEGCFDSITLQDLCDRGDASGVRRKAPRRYVYSI